MWTIKIVYETGDSSGRYLETTFIGYAWHDLEQAKKSLTRIKEHYENCKGDYFVPICTDKGGERDISAFWIGDFERLLEASIVPYGYDSSFSYKP
jgi:hypothetical protein